MISGSILHYRILEKLGEGGMGEVFLAEDTKLDRKVALKFLPPALQKDRDARERLVREAKAASRLNHPNILTVYAVERHEDRDFIVMEYVPGESLGDHLASASRSIDDLLALIRQIAAGLQHAHKAGVVHRDLKPANILLDAERRPRILDFGLAKFEGAAQVTRSGVTTGTLMYLAPEQVLGGHSDQRSDLFALGVIFYEMIAGARPFGGEHEAAVLYAIVHETPVPLTELRPDTPQSVQNIVDRLLAKEPESRYQEVGELLADLTQAQDGVPGVRVRAPRKWVRPFGVATILTAILIVGSFYLWQRWSSPETAAKRLVVLPFENLGHADDEYFSDGITDEITARLASIAGLGVISRTSAMKFKASELTLPEIARKLNVDYVLEGTVLWDRTGQQEHVRIIPQLIRVEDDTHLWAETYDRALFQVFALQTDIATQIAAALNLTLLAPARRVIEARPTRNMAAYQAYLHGIDFASRPEDWTTNPPAAVESFERAVTLDSTFAVAFARLSIAHSQMHHFGLDETEGRLRLAFAAATKALELEPDLPEGHMALGYYHYWGHRDFAPALAEFAQAAQGMPNSSEVTFGIASVLRRQGKLSEALAEYEKAFELDPLSILNLHNVAETYGWMRRYADAEREYDRSIAMEPDQWAAYNDACDLYIAWRGDTARARRLLEQCPRTNPDQAYDYQYLRRDYKAAYDILSRERDSLWESQWGIDVPACERGRMLGWLGRIDEARLAFDTARALVEAELVKRPDDHRLHSALGLAFAGLGRKDEAIKEGLRGCELMPVSKDALIATHRMTDLAMIYTMVGEYDGALDMLDTLLTMPSRLSVHKLRLYATWDPLRELPRFQALLKRGDKVY